MLQQQLLVTVISYGILRSATINARCIGGKCGRISIGRQKDHQTLRTMRYVPLQYYYQKHHHHHHQQQQQQQQQHYQLGTICLDCETDKNIISDNCCNCCCKQAQQLTDNDNCNSDKKNTCGGSLSTTINCHSSNKPSPLSSPSQPPPPLSSSSSSTSSTSSTSTSPTPDLEISEEIGESSRSISSTSDKLSSENENLKSCPFRQCCPVPEQCSRNSITSCPVTKTCFNPESMNSENFKKHLALSIIPEGVPIIPSPQLDFLTNGDKIGFNTNIQDFLHLSTIKPPIAKNPLAQDPPVDNFPPHDCCTQCNGANCMPRDDDDDDNAKRALAANILNGNRRRDRDVKCKSKQLRKLMIANIRRNPSRSKRLIKEAAEKKFAASFNVICSRGDFSYVIHTTEYCEVSTLGNNCYAFKV